MSTLREQIDNLAPEKYARDALAAARSAERRADALGLPLPESVRKLLDIPEAELARRRAKAIAAATKPTSREPQQPTHRIFGHSANPVPSVTHAPTQDNFDSQDSSSEKYSTGLSADVQTTGGWDIDLVDHTDDHNLGVINLIGPYTGLYGIADTLSPGDFLPPSYLPDMSKINKSAQSRMAASTLSSVWRTIENRNLAIKSFSSQELPNVSANALFKYTERNQNRTGRSESVRIQNLLNHSMGSLSNWLDDGQQPAKSFTLGDTLIILLSFQEHGEGEQETHAIHGEVVDRTNIGENAETLTVRSEGTNMRIPLNHPSLRVIKVIANPIRRPSLH